MSGSQGCPVNVQWPGQELVRDELDQVSRRLAFKAAHPGAEFGRAGTECIGHVPYTNADGEECSITIRDASYKDVLDALEEYFAPDPDAWGRGWGVPDSATGPDG